MGEILENFTADIYRRFTTDYEAHKPCATCESAHGRQDMCPAGRARYEQMLGELGDERFKGDQAPGLCDDCKARKAAAGDRFEVCHGCALKALTFHGWIRDGVFYTTRPV